VGIKCGSEEFYIVFMQLASRKAVRVFGWRMWLVKLRGLIWSRGLNNPDDFAHVLALKPVPGGVIMFSQKCWGYHMQFIGVEIEDALDSLCNNRRCNAILEYHAPRTKDMRRNWTIQHGVLCHTVVANLLGLREKVRSPLDLWRVLREKKAVDVLQYNFAQR